MEELEEVHVGIQSIFHPLQDARGEGAQGTTHSLCPATLAEDDEAVQEWLAAGNVLQSQVWDSMSKLQRGKAILESSW